MIYLRRKVQNRLRVNGAVSMLAMVRQLFSPARYHF